TFLFRTMRFSMSFRQFYTHEYIDCHPTGICRLLHLLGTPAAVVLLVVIVWLERWWLLILLPVPVYFLAWLGHVAVHNRPTAFEHPVWSFLGYCKLVGSMVAGKLGVLRKNSENP